MRTPLACACLLLASVAAQAQSFEVRGFLEARAASGADETAWREGGLGKTRFGDGDSDLGGNAAIAVDWQATPTLLLSASAQAVPDQRQNVDLLDAWVRYRPVSTTPWRASFTAGMFFAPISMENDGVGWTSAWTITPSAIDSWVGEELRTFGGEARIEHRGDNATWDVRAALFTRNDPAGELLSSRGWAMGDLTSGLETSLREPDAYAAMLGAPVPMLFKPFVEIDDALGVYVAVGRESSAGRARLLYYDNRTDASLDTDYAGRDVYGWHTRFWSGGLTHRFDEWEVAAQAMSGTTTIAPGGMEFDTEFNAGYVLLARTFEAWQPVLRIDLFQTADSLREHGNALTAALNWRPRDHVRVIGEVLRIDSSSEQRVFAGLPSKQIDTQVQVAVRWYF
ncbi:hypothetical protein LVB87_13065 [Lysobacter sp. KIS68-7]|uniref:hypothetical protein n=1 Tax=Lysobacter sp. KIS68-7 TaxID=2904252 RepID=UPI001E4E85B1|nr:hypothetical protein [Lysobacter sp. KIS68-7]UHQ19105.1 hypothetical protein LVB87_13065 [Lysobacter sp. KIS68-7]